MSLSKFLKVLLYKNGPTGGILSKLKKSSKEDFSRDGICIRFLVSSKLEPFNFLVNSCSKIYHVSKF